VPNVRLIVEYDGSRFHGWQIQPGLRTIEGELERVISLVLRETIHPIYASGRTDAGVHARRQVVNFHTTAAEPDLLRLSHSISNLLRGELAVLAADIVPDDFNSRYSAKSKQYSYHILNRFGPAVLDRGRCWYVGSPLDVERMHREAQTLVGEHDFTSFRGSGCHATTAVKTIFESEVYREGDRIVYRVVGSGFLKHMIRNIAGTLVALAQGRLAYASMQAVLDAKDRRVGGMTAPAHGLFLDWVDYDDRAAGAPR
jgi:tRNA pseudouridine38-40 synthase